MDRPLPEPLPAAISPALAARWQIVRADFVAQTRCSTVYRVERRKGLPAALKIVTPYARDDELRGTALLGWYGKAHAAEVIARDGPAVLLEWLDGEPLSTLVHRGEDEKATAILCALVEKLHAPRATPPPGELPDLEGWFDPLLAVDPAGIPDSRRALFGRARDLARTLVDTQPDPVPLHGDLHHDNVMASDYGWRVIDPKAIRGDPAYEFANTFCNPLGALELARTPARIRMLADAYSGALGLDRDRIVGWAVAHCAISMCWAGVVTDADHEVFTILEALDAVYRRS